MDGSKSDKEILQEAIKKAASGLKSTPGVVGKGVVSGAKAVGKGAGTALLWGFKAATTSVPEATRTAKKLFVEKTEMGKDWKIYPIGMEDFNKKSLGIDWFETTRQFGHGKEVGLFIPRAFLPGKEIREFEEFLENNDSGSLNEAKYSKNKLYQLHKLLDEVDPNTQNKLGSISIRLTGNGGSYQKELVITLNTDCTYEEFEKRVAKLFEALDIASPASVKEATRRLWEGHPVEFPSSPELSKSNTPNTQETPAPSPTPEKTQTMEQEPSEVVQMGNPVEFLATPEINEPEPQQPQVTSPPSVEPQIPLTEQPYSRPTLSNASTQADDPSTTPSGNTYIINNNITNINNYYNINLIQINYGDQLFTGRDGFDRSFEWQTKQATTEVEQQTDGKLVKDTSTSVDGDLNKEPEIHQETSGQDVVDSVHENQDKLKSREGLGSLDNETLKDVRTLFRNSDISNREGLGDVSDDTLKGVSNLFESEIDKIDSRTQNTDKAQKPKVREQSPQEVFLAMIKSNLAHLQHNLPDAIQKGSTDLMQNLTKATGVLDILIKKLIDKGGAAAQLDENDIKSVETEKGISLKSFTTIFSDIQNIYDKEKKANSQEKPVTSRATDAENKMEAIKVNIQKIPALKNSIYPAANKINAQEVSVGRNNVSKMVANLGNSLKVGGLISCAQEANSNANSGLPNPKKGGGITV